MMHLVLTAAALLISVLGSTLGARDPYSVRVDYSKYIINGSYSPPSSCDVLIKTEPDCIPGSGNKTPSLIPGCEAESLVFDMEGCCLVCPKPARETCGGWLYQHGRCPDGYECLHEVLTKGTFVLYMAPDGRKDGPTGKCICELYVIELMLAWYISSVLSRLQYNLGCCSSYYSTVRHSLYIIYSWFCCIKFYCIMHAVYSMSAPCIFKLLEWLMAAVWAATFDMKQSC